MIWDILNAAIGVLVGVVHSVFASLPTSPIYIDSGSQAALAPMLGNLAWFLPIHLMFITFGLWVVGVLILAGILLVKQLLEAAIP